MTSRCAVRFSKSKDSLLNQFLSFSDKLNKLWHEKPDNIYGKLHISSIHDNVHLLKERLPPPVKLTTNIDFKQDLISVALYQVSIFACFSILIVHLTMHLICSYIKIRKFSTLINNWN